MFKFKLLASVSALALQLVPALASASGYPANYAHQVVTVVQFGGSLYAHVGSGVISLEVLGYKRTGMLAASNPARIDAIVTARCQGGDGSTITRQSVIVLNPEWNGTGYMSAPFTTSNVNPQGCSYTSRPVLEVAFSDGRGGWDSNYGRNFPLNPWVENVARLSTNAAGSEINAPAWAFIVDQMRR